MNEKLGYSPPPNPIDQHLLTLPIDQLPEGIQDWATQAREQEQSPTIESTEEQS